MVSGGYNGGWLAGWTRKWTAAQGITGPLSLQQRKQCFEELLVGASYATDAMVTTAQAAPATIREAQCRRFDDLTDRTKVASETCEILRLRPRSNILTPRFSFFSTDLLTIVEGLDGD